MSKLDFVIGMFISGDLRSNAEIAKEMECDEGIVRRARTLSQIATLKERVATLENQLKSCRCHLPPRKAKARPEPLRLLWEREENGEFIPTVPMLGD